MTNANASIARPVAVAKPGAKLLNPHDHTLIMIDFQSQMAFATHSIDPVQLRSNAALVASAAAGFGASTILTTVAEKSFSGPMFEEVTSPFPGQALLDRGLNAARPVVVLSENTIEHALLALGCIYAGVPYCPVSPAYATVSQDYDKLRHVIDTLTPGLVFAADGARYGKAIEATVAADVEVILAQGALEGRKAGTFQSLRHTTATPAVDAAMHATGPGTIVKFLFTSGSTKMPKPVINTQRMWCANLQQISLSLPVLAEASPVLVDWLPWNHTFGSNHNFGLTMMHGGTLYIDDGKPTAALIGETLRNLREIAPTEIGRAHV